MEDNKIYEILEKFENWTPTVRRHAEETCVFLILKDLKNTVEEVRDEADDQYSQYDQTGCEESDYYYILVGLIIRGMRGVSDFSNNELAGTIHHEGGEQQFIDRINGQGDWETYREELSVEDNDNA